MKVPLKISGYQWENEIRKEKIHWNLNADSVEEAARISRLRRFGQVLCMNRSRLPKEIIE